MRHKTTLFPIFLFFLPLILQAQNWKWAKSLGSANSNTSVANIRPYTSGHMLISGNFDGANMSLGSHTLQNAGQDDGFVAIADATGQYAWAARIGGAGRDFVVDAAAAPNGDFAVAGIFNSISMTIGASALFNSGETDAFVAKFNQNGTVAWAKKIGSQHLDEVSQVAVDSEGNVYVAGQVRDKFTNATIHAFLQKMDAAGTLIWEQKATIQGFGYLQSSALALDNAQHIYFSGTLNGTVNIGGAQLTCDTTTAAFIAKFSPAGMLMGTDLNPAMDKINGLRAHNGKLYACAEKVNWGIGWGWPLSDSKIHVLQLDENLNTLWHKTTGGGSPAQSLDIANGISVDNNGNAYVTGYFFSDTLHFAGEAHPNLFNVDYYYPQIFVLKYAPNGDEVWVKTLGGIHSDMGTSILAIGDDKLCVGGHFESNPVSFGTHELLNTSPLESMYVHLRPERFVRKTVGFLALFDKAASNTLPPPAFQSLAIFPNPATEQIYLRLTTPGNAPVHCQISTADGRLVRETRHAGPVGEVPGKCGRLAARTLPRYAENSRGVFLGRFVKNGG
jgi:Beta-propeller repeat.